MSKEYRGLGHEVKQHASSRPTKIHLLAIGIDNYKHNTDWPALTYPVKDCQGLAKALHDRYALASSKVLLNEGATMDDVLEALDKITSRNEQGHPHIGADESLIVYFAGHGCRYANKQQDGKDSDKGALVLYDSGDIAKHKDPASQLLDFEKLAEWLGKSQAGHLLLILDTCFGGLFQDLQVNLPPELIPIAPANDIHTPSRWVLTSGRWEPVPDKSHFAEVLIELLRTNRDRRVSIDSLYGKLRDKITTFNELQSARPPIPIPYCRNFVRKMDGGDFFFELNRETHELVVEQESQSLSETLRKQSATYRESLIKGRFRYLWIEQVLLPGTSLPPLLEVEVSLNQKHSYLKQALDSLWNQGKRQAVLLGNGGTGKTVSLLNIWEELLSNQNGPIPVYIPLNAYNIVRDNKQDNFVLHYIAGHYLGEAEPTAESVNQLRDFFHLQKEESKSPSLILLLDGYNEITASDKSRLDIELGQLYETSLQVQWIVTSRYIEITNFEWARQSEVLELQTLSRETVQLCLDQTNTVHPENEDVWELLGNPMALTCYVGTESVRREFTGDDEFKFFEVKKFAELIWNFQEVQLAQAKKRKSTEREYVYSVFLIRYLLPYVACRMEQEGHYFIPLKRNGESKFYLKQLVEDWVETGITEGFLGEFPSITRISEDLQLGSKSELAPTMRNQKIRETLLFQLKAMVQEGDELGFLHQNFRDFYAACHLLNCVKFALAEGKRPPEWKERTFPVYLRRMIGELEGEYLFDPYKLLEVEEVKRKIPSRIVYNQLTRLMDCCRGPKDMTGDYTVWNLVMILHETRETLAGADLSRLDLRGIVLNGISLSIRNELKYLTVNLNGIRGEGKIFVSNGHTSYINSIAYSSNSKKVLSASADGTFKEWSVETKECLHTFVGHQSAVSSATYSFDGKKIISSSWDNTIKEWLIETGECIRTYKGHEDIVNSAVYSNDGERILSASYDNTVREWSRVTGECIRIITGHKSSVFSAIYSPDGQKILSSSFDETVREWYANTGECVKVLNAPLAGEKPPIYSPDGSKILFISSDHTIREWQRETETDLESSVTYLTNIDLAIYSPNGRTILSASSDGGIKEWSVETGKCLQSFQGPSAIVTHLAYNPDGKKILISSGLGSITELSIHNGKHVGSINITDSPINSAVYSPDEKKILASSSDNTIKEWIIDGGKCVQTLIGHTDCVYSATYDTNGEKILSASADGLIKEWSIRTGLCIRTYRGHGDGVIKAIYSPDAKKILSASVDKTIKEWSVGNGECIGTYVGHVATVVSIGYDKKGEKILSASFDHTVKEWSTETGKCIQTFKGDLNGYRYALYDINDRRILTISDNKIEEWDVETTKCLFSWPAIGANYAVYAPSGKAILYNDYEKIVEYCVDSRKSQRTFVEHDDTVNSIICNLTGDKLLSSSEDGSVIEWSIACGKRINKLDNFPGLFVHGLDLRNLHPDSVFTEEEKDRMRRYGAIFDDQDKADWEAAVEDAYGKE